MPTATEVDVSDLTEFEFAESCQVMYGCNLAAVALYARSHTLEGCWGAPIMFCQKHLVQSLRMYEEWLSLGGVCAGCQGPVVGSLHQNVRIVRL